jgi:hypothetical protein
MATTLNSTIRVEAFPTGMLPRVASSGSRVRGRVKAPFAITTMNEGHVGTLLWVWARRGRQWIISQELRAPVASNLKEHVRKDA